MKKASFFSGLGKAGGREQLPYDYRLLLNMPLLFWAGEVTGEENYIRKAEAHIKTAMKNIIREDHSTYHTFFSLILRQENQRRASPIRGIGMVLPGQEAGMGNLRICTCL